LSLVVAHVAGPGQELDSGPPLLLARLDLAYEGVEMAHERFADLAHAGVGRLPDALQHGVGNGVFIESFASSPPWSPSRARLVRRDARHV
jgi:hypothetical protein